MPASAPTGAGGAALGAVLGAAEWGSPYALAGVVLVGSARL